MAEDRSPNAVRLVDGQLEQFHLPGASPVRVPESVEPYSGPAQLCRVQGRVQIRVHWLQGAEGHPACWAAAALGWYTRTDLVATGSDYHDLIAYLAARFPRHAITGTDATGEPLPKMISR